MTFNVGAVQNGFKAFLGEFAAGAGRNLTRGLE